ncbi:MAG: ribosome silencing factor [Actinobacteria bacterium]|nr:ribosome silencing factor [Actinomycetota bacterium]
MADTNDARARALTAAAAAASKKADEIVVLDVGEILAITDFFVIASGANDRQVKAIVEEVEVQCKRRLGTAPLRVEGLNERRWVLIDYGDVWVHVFDRDTRSYYELERLWADAPRVPFEDPATGVAVS